MDLIILAIPAFFILIALELVFQFRKGVKLYRFNDAITNISCGITQQVSGLFTKSLLFVTYYWVYEHARIWNVKDTWYSYVILLFLVDLCYYFFHRYAHEIALFWGSHSVHHQSEDYNFSVALRQSTLQTFVSAWFYLPLAFIGFSFTAFITIAAIQTLYQFWIHTEVIKKMPRWFEFIFNTPSHHRVHHASDPKYIDKNHGGTFIIWDRIFGTFTEEKDPINYGVTKPVQSWNTLWVNLEYYKWLWSVFIQSKGMDKWRVLFNKTGWRPDYLGGALLPQDRPEGYEKYDVSGSKRVNYYIFILFLGLLTSVSVFLFSTKGMSSFNMVIYTGLVLWIVLNIGALLESKPWAKLSEILRIITSLAVFLVINIDAEVWIKVFAVVVSVLFFMIYLTFNLLEEKTKSPILAK